MSTNNRAQLLSGLRTARSIPQTAAPGASFNIPRVPSGLQSSVFPQEDDIQSQYAQFAQHHANRAMPMTAAVDGPGFLRQQNAAPFYPQHVQAQALQMQMMQIEIMRMQALQAQQYQAHLFAAQNQSENARRPNFNPPATAGPTGSFDMRSATLGAQMRRSQGQDNEQGPMTAALDGKFGIRPTGRFPAEQHDEVSGTTVISGGTSLGSSAPAVSKSESAANWRRAGNNNSVLRKKSSLSPLPMAKARPQGLSINSAPQPLPVVAIDNSESENDDGYSTSSSDSAPTNSPPTTPRSASSIELSTSTNMKPALVSKSVVTRQPRGPPSGPDELGPRNFASRLAVRA
ncbi:hypothetical protein C8F01DRAFT_423356 [Mycena amicta]|nr:hypothetical protein C8F01DRAFT_423356 [Mycena amicta]